MHTGTPDDGRRASACVLRTGNRDDPRRRENDPDQERECGPNVTGFFSVKVGIFTFIPSRSKYTWFAAYVAGDRGGTYRKQKVAFEHGGRHFQVWPNTVKLNAAPNTIPRRGTFAGRTDRGQPVSGSFTC